ncbi:MAG: glycosyltransferase family 39 protein [Anaerolineales bacterium]
MQDSSIKSLPKVRQRILDGRSNLRVLIWPALISLAFVILALFFFPGWRQLILSTDEGIELARSMLVDRGYSMYSQIWSDHPPLFTYMLVGIFRLVGERFYFARLLTLGLSVSLLWSVFYFLYLAVGKWTAVAGTLLVVLLPMYLTLSVSIMIGLPAIALAAVSLALLAAWHTHRSGWALALSAILLTLSVMIKVFTGLLAPIFVLGLLAAEIYRQPRNASWRMRLAPAVVWGLIFSISLVGLGWLLVGPQYMTQLLTIHLEAGTTTIFLDETFSLAYVLQPVHPILFLAALGGVYAIVNRRWLLLYPLAWMLAALLLLSNLRPVWLHHQLLVTIPAAMLASVPVYEVLAWLVEKLTSHQHEINIRNLLLVGALFGLGLYLFTWRVPEPLRLVSWKPVSPLAGFDLSEAQENVLRQINKYAPQTRWIVTDLPTYGFLAGLPVPPELAVMSMKRIETGDLTQADILQTIQKYHPEQVLLGRREYPQVQAYLGENYRRISDKKLQQAGFEYYIRLDLPQ